MIQRLVSLWRTRPQKATKSSSGPIASEQVPGFALEPRIMLDAALVSTGAEALSEADNQQDQASTTATAPSSAEARSSNEELAAALESINPLEATREVFIIDPSVPDYETLLADIPENAQVHILSSSASLDEIAEVLAGYQNLDAVHIISHGSTGSLSLSGETVNSDSLEASEEALAAIGRSLNEDGDILLYGCNVSSNGEGLDFIEQLAELTGADVAASDDLTGQGGDWELEVTVGAVAEPDEVVFAPASDYAHSLTTSTFNFDITADGGCQCQ